MADSGSKFFDQFVLGAEARRAYTRLSEPSHPQSARLIAFWRDKERDGGLTVGRDLPSRAISGLLSSLIVYQPVSDGSDFRVRHTGTAYIAHYGRDVTGSLMSELFDPETFRHNLASAHEVVERGAPEIFEACLSQFGIERRRYEIVLLPAWSPDRTARWLLCGMFKFD